jgi:hypothetical protein
MELYDNSGTVLLASTTTDSEGNWYFNASNVPGDLLPGTNYKVRVTTSQFSLSGIGPLAGYTLAVPNQTGNGIAGYSDSDALLMGDGSVEMSVSTGDYGWSNHHLDIGFINSVLLDKETISLKASAKNKKVELKWQVEGNNNFTSFAIEYSTDGRNFNEINRAEKVNNKTLYSYVHSTASAQTNYYRVKAKASNGKVYYTPVQIIFFEEKTTIKIYPNPIISDIMIQLPTNMANKQIQFTLINDIGQQLISKKIQRANGQEKINVSMLKNGVYYLKVEASGGEMEVRKILILK